MRLTHNLLVAISLICLYMLSFLAMRMVMQGVFVPEASAQDLWIAYEMGSRLDLRVVCMGMAAILLFGYIIALLTPLSKRLHQIPANTQATTKGGGIAHKILLAYIAIISFLVCFSAIGNFYYFKTYHTRIDTFIFGIKDDDTLAVLQVIWQDYPVLLIFIACVLYAYICVRITQKILSLKLPDLRTTSAIALHIIAIVLLFLGIRGSIDTQPLKEDTISTTQDQNLNHLIFNPILALHYAHTHYKNAIKFQPTKLTEGIALQNEIFPIFFRHTQGVTKPFLPTQNTLESPETPTLDSHTPPQSTNSPHIVAVLMESFASNMLALDDAKDFDLLGSFRPYFESGKHKKAGQNDFVFTHFLSGGNHTAASFALLLPIAPHPTISLSTAKATKLPLTPIDVYKNAGYEVIFITSGNQNWYNLGDYLKILGVDAVYDSSYIAQHYPQSKTNAWAFGNADEYAFSLATEILLEAQKPTFIIILTISNHQPFATPKSFNPPTYTLDSKVDFFSYDNPARIRLLLEAFTYASDAFGKFVSDIRNSPTLKDNVIIGASGDHLCRDMKQGANIALDHSVPFYLYIPTHIAKGLEFDPETLGSHKDIFPTLYALSLKDYEFLSLGGRNLFEAHKKGNESYDFAYNDAVWIDKEGIYPIGTDTGFHYITKDGLIIPQENFQIPESKKQFINNYNKLSWWQINYRIYNTSDITESK